MPDEEQKALNGNLSWTGLLIDSVLKKGGNLILKIWI